MLSTEQIQRWAAMATTNGASGRLVPLPSSSPSAPVSPGEDAIDLEAYIEHHGFSVKEVKPCGRSGKIWVLQHCLFNPSHMGSSAAMGYGDDRQKWYKCHHDSCADKRWSDVRETFGPAELTPKARRAKANVAATLVPAPPGAAGVAATKASTAKGKKRGAKSEPKTPKDPNAPRIIDYAMEFIQSLNPTHHIGGKKLFIRSIHRELSIRDLWHELNDAWIDGAGATLEGFSGEEEEEEEGAGFQGNLKLLKNVLPIAATALMKTLPDAENTGADPTLNIGDLQSRLVALLLAPRTRRKDNGTFEAVTYLAMVQEFAPGAWRQCKPDPVYGRLDKVGDLPQVGVKVDWLAAQMQPRDPRKFLRNLELSGLLVPPPETARRVAGTTLRFATFATSVVEEAASTPTSEGDEVAQVAEKPPNAT